MKKQTRGFTLIELILALSLLAVISTALSGVLYQAIQTWKKGHKTSLQKAQVRVAFEELARDLRNAVPFPKNPIEGSDQKLVFNTIKNAEGPQKGPALVKVTYLVSESLPATHSEPLFEFEKWEEEYDADEPTPKRRRVVLASSVNKLTFAYAQESNQWVPDWTQRTGFPMGIQVHLSFWEGLSSEDSYLWTRTFFIPQGSKT